MTRINSGDLKVGDKFAVPYLGTANVPNCECVDQVEQMVTEDNGWIRCRVVKGCNGFNNSSDHKTGSIWKLSNRQTILRLTMATALERIEK